MNDAEKVIGTLRARGIVSASMDNGQCKRKIVELGLTIPEGKNDCLVYGIERQVAMYVFVCFRDPTRGFGDHGFLGLRFDFAKYRSNPLAPDWDIRKACALFACAAAELTGFDMANCTPGTGSSFRN